MTAKASRNVINKIIFISVSFIVMLLSQSGAALAHSPYFRDISSWMTLDNQEYKLQGWYGDGIFFQDPMRVILIHKNGGLAAYTELGYDGEADCPSLENCWVSIKKRDDKEFVIYRLQPGKMKRVPNPQKDNTAGGPKILDGAAGFEPSADYAGHSLHFRRWQTWIAAALLLSGVAGFFFAGSQRVKFISRALKRSNNG